ncbi:MAG: hypothetical protein NVSMB65_17840 [Chloroflexota bacterium]
MVFVNKGFVLQTYRPAVGWRGVRDGPYDGRGRGTEHTMGARESYGETAVFGEGSVYDPPGDDGVRCLVMRTWPRGVAYERVDVWLKELGPTPDLLRALAAGAMHWGEFALAYRRQLETRAPSREALAQVRALAASSGKVTLLCHERGFPCHRFILLDVLAGRA